MASKQQKKTDLKKTTVEEDTLASNSSSSGQQQQQTVPSDVYEFVSTPKHSSCSSGDENPIKAFDKSSLDDKSGTDSDTQASQQQQQITTLTSSLSSAQQQQKRTLVDHQDRNDETLSQVDEDSKRKKRKDSEFPQGNQASNLGGKEVKSSTNTNRVTSRVGQKPPGPASKTMGLIGKGDRKSPCESPKIPSTKSPSDNNEAENDEKGSGEGPKVPPLKIVIPQQQQQQPQAQGNQIQSQNQGNLTDSQDGTLAQQSGTNNQRTNIKNAASSRNATNSSSLPYVLNASSDSNSNDKQENLTTATRSLSPSADSNKSNNDEKPSGKSSKETRVTRSSQRGGKDSKDDRSSNNSSPQLPASSTPSPAAQISADSSSAGTESESNNNNQTNSSSSVPTSSANIQGNSATTSISQNQNQQPQPQPSTSSTTQSSVELHPRKRKIKASSNKDQPAASSSSSALSSAPGPSTSSSSADLKDSNSKDGNDKAQSGEPVHPHDQPFTNCYQMYIDLRKQIEQRHRNLHPIEPRPLKGLEDYLMNRRTYSLNGKTSTEPNIIIPPLLPTQMKDTFVEQEKERHKLKMKHNVEKEKLVLSKEQEILRVHCKAAQMQAGQPQPFSVCAILKDEEVYNPITPEPEERYNNRSFFKELKDLDDKWDKIKEAMIIRHTNEAESLHAVQKMDWGWKLKEFLLCDYRATPEIEELHVPMVDVSDEYTTPSIKN